ncbi:hypothetical protein PtA15_3A317 [Puccinia triticina]|uniref:Uncharacterized protein n=1 Tax=Puccinia triticina TaxID=208348 RepID=A0ABY7CCK5_9BASI|nr:uncharacterized protein PtA15_3A317 [Puccinia triticina]WAQ82951.1 hypothetical protein PtA15_3A317 [Puccinia triticina]
MPKPKKRQPPVKIASTEFNPDDPRNHKDGLSQFIWDVNPDHKLPKSLKNRQAERAPVSPTPNSRSSLSSVETLPAKSPDHKNAPPARKARPARNTRSPAKAAQSPVRTAQSPPRPTQSPITGKKGCCCLWEVSITGKNSFKNKQVSQAHPSVNLAFPHSLYSRTLSGKTIEAGHSQRQKKKPRVQSANKRTKHKPKSCDECSSQDESKSKDSLPTESSLSDESSQDPSGSQTSNTESDRDNRASHDPSGSQTSNTKSDQDNRSNEADRGHNKPIPKRDMRKVTRSQSHKKTAKQPLKSALTVRKKTNKERIEDIQADVEVRYKDGPRYHTRSRQLPASFDHPPPDHYQAAPNDLCYVEEGLKDPNSYARPTISPFLLLPPDRDHQQQDLPIPPSPAQNPYDPCPKRRRYVRFSGGHPMYATPGLDHHGNQPQPQPSEWCFTPASIPFGPTPAETQCPSDSYSYQATQAQANVAPTYAPSYGYSPQSFDLPASTSLPTHFTQANQFQSNVTQRPTSYSYQSTQPQANAAPTYPPSYGYPQQLLDPPEIKSSPTHFDYTPQRFGYVSETPQGFGYTPRPARDPKPRVPSGPTPFDYSQYWNPITQSYLTSQGPTFSLQKDSSSNGQPASSKGQSFSFTCPSSTQETAPPLPQEKPLPPPPRGSGEFAPTPQPIPFSAPPPPLIQSVPAPANRFGQSALAQSSTPTGSGHFVQTVPIQSSHLAQSKRVGQSVPTSQPSTFGLSVPAPPPCQSGHSGPTTQPSTFGQSAPPPPSSHFGQSAPTSTFGLSMPAPPPCQSGQSVSTPQPSIFGQSAPPPPSSQFGARTSTFGLSVPPPPPCRSGQSVSTPQPSIFGQSAPPPPFSQFGQSAPTCQPITFGQSTPPAPLRPSLTFQNSLVGQPAPPPLYSQSGQSAPTPQPGLSGQSALPQFGQSFGQALHPTSFGHSSHAASIKPTVAPMNAPMNNNPFWDPTTVPLKSALKQRTLVTQPHLWAEKAETEFLGNNQDSPVHPQLLPIPATPKEAPAPSPATPVTPPPTAPPAPVEPPPATPASTIPPAPVKPPSVPPAQVESLPPVPPPAPVKPLPPAPPPSHEQPPAPPAPPHKRPTSPPAPPPFHERPAAAPPGDERPPAPPAPPPSDKQPPAPPPSDTRQPAPPATMMTPLKPSSHSPLVQPPASHPPLPMISATECLTHPVPNTPPISSATST